MCCNQMPHGGKWEEVAGVAGELLTRVPTSAARCPDSLCPPAAVQSAGLASSHCAAFPPPAPSCGFQYDSKATIFWAESVLPLGAPPQARLPQPLWTVLTLLAQGKVRHGAPRSLCLNIRRYSQARELLSKIGSVHILRQMVLPDGLEGQGDL